jgi:hypothetical protein
MNSNTIKKLLKEFAIAEDYECDDLGNFRELEDADGLEVSLGNTEFIIFKNRDEAKEYAIQGIEGDLEYNQDFFDQNWLRSTMKNITPKDLSNAGTVYRAVAIEAINEDGLGHFLAGYDGNECDLDSDGVYFRTN